MLFGEQKRLSGRSAIYPVIILTVWLASAAQTVSAEEAEEPLETLMVTATRTAQTADDTLASVSVVTRDDIERQQAQSVQDSLRGLPGINITNNGGAGKATSVFLRGTESDHVLVLIDGIKVGSATRGRTAFQHIPIEQIERIEVVRGPRASLYGSEAIGGVIQIFTRKGGGRLKPFFSAGTGSYKNHSASAGISGGGKNGWFSASVSGNDARGFNACDGKPSPGGAGCFTIEPDKDGYENLSVSLRAGYRFGSGLEIDTHALRSSGKSEFDGRRVNESNSVQQVWGGTARSSPTDIWRLNLAVGRSRDKSDNFKDGDFKSRFSTVRNSASLQNDVQMLDDHMLTLGIDYQDDKVGGTTDYTVTSRDDKGLFAQYQGTFPAHDLQLSVRHDDNEQFGAHTTLGAAWRYALSNELRITASYGTAFKAPTFNELYFPGYGNPDLGAEESRSIEFGLGGNFNWGSWAFNAYETRVDELIVFDSSIFAPANIGHARIRGLEVTLATQIEAWEINTNFSLLDPENRSSDANNGNLLPRRAEQSLRVSADRKFNKYTIGATLFAEGSRFDDLANTRKLGGYVTVDLRAEYMIARNWRLQARIENLFDKVYETAAFFNQPGRGLFVTLRFQS